MAALTVKGHDYSLDLLRIIFLGKGGLFGHFSTLYSWFATCDPEFITDQDHVFTSLIFPSTDDGQMRTKETDRETDWCHVGVYLSTTTGRNTSRAEPGQGQWIWLGQAAIWMARGEGRKGEGRRRGIRRNQPANQPKPTWRMEQLQRGGRRGREGGGERERDWEREDL